MFDPPVSSPGDESADGVGALAARALALVAKRAAQARRDDLSETAVTELLAAALGRSDESYRHAVSRMRARGIGADGIVGGYVPEVATRLGELWCEDEASFAEVTLAMSRMQSLVRELAEGWHARVGAAAPSVLVVLPEDTDHTLGALVISSLLRHRGVAAHLLIAPEPDEVAGAVASDGHRGVMISAARSDAIDKVRQLVHCAQTARPSDPAPVILGGSIADDEKGSRIGADLVTSDLDEALRFCGIEAR